MRKHLLAHVLGRIGERPSTKVYFSSFQLLFTNRILRPTAQGNTSCFELPYQFGNEYLKVVVSPGNVDLKSPDAEKEDI